MPDIPIWWAKQSTESRLLFTFMGVVAFIFALVLLPPILILVGLAMIGYGVISHIYHATVCGSPWTRFEGMHLFFIITGFLVFCTGALLTWIF